MNQVRIIFKNNVQIDGEVIYQEGDTMSIRSIDGTKTIIPSVTNSVVFYQIPPEETVHVQPKKPRTPQYPSKEAIRIHPSFAQELRKVFGEDTNGRTM